MNNGDLYFSIGLVVLILAIIVIWYFFYKEDLFPFYLNQIAMKHDDPTYFQYKGRNRDILGMSGVDYYLEHDMLAKTGSEPYYHNNNLAKYNNTTDYMQLNPSYRPKPSVTTVVLDHPQ